MTQPVDRSPKLTDDQTVEIRRRAAAGDEYPDIAADYGVSRKTVSAIAVGRIRPDVGGPRVRKGRWGDVQIIPDPNSPEALTPTTNEEEA